MRGKMPEIRIRDCDESLHRKLRAWAGLEGKSLQKLILELLAEAVDKRGPKIEPRK
jgi:predicted HicB family RNase H-like nuclease